MNLKIYCLIPLIFISFLVNAQLSSTPYVVWNNPGTGPSSQNVRASTSTSSSVLFQLSTSRYLVATQYIPSTNGWDWYKVDLPDPTASKVGYVTAWYQGGGYQIVPACDKGKILVTNSFINIRSGAGTTNSFITIGGQPAKVWSGQYFAYTGLTQNVIESGWNNQWRQIYLPDNCNAATGWIATNYQGVSWATLNTSVPNPLPSPVLTAPSGSQITSNSITYTWSSVLGASSYQFNMGGNSYYPSSSPKTISGLSSGATYTANVQTAFGGCYSPISNTVTTTTSNPCTTVTSTSNLPSNPTVLNGNAISLSTTANGTGPFTFKWFYDNTPVQEITQSSNYSTFTSLPLTLLDDGHYFKCIVANCSGGFTAGTNNCVLDIVNCINWSIGPDQPSVPGSGYTNYIANISATGNFGCPYTTSSNSWIHVTSASANLITYDVDPNPSTTSPRSGVIELYDGPSFLTALYVDQLPSLCANWGALPGGLPSSHPNYVNAYEYLCNLDIVPNNPPTDYLSDISRLKLSYLLYNSLYHATGSFDAPRFFPNTFLDIDGNIAAPDSLLALKAMLYLEYCDGVSPISRDYFQVDPRGSNYNLGFQLKTIMEALNKQPDWTGYVASSNATSSFYYDVLLNNPYYGYFKKASQFGWLPVTNCLGNNCVGATSNLTYEKAIIIIKNIISSQPPPVPNPNLDYFIPNNFADSSGATTPGIDRACFSNYSEDGININIGGLPLSLYPIYNSHKLDYSFALNELADTNINKLFKQLAYPIGMGWSHNYNMYIIDGTAVTNKYIVCWPDGRTEFVNRTTHLYLSRGSKDVFQTSNVLGVDYITITTPDLIIYKFKKDPTLNAFKIYSIQDRNTNTLTFNYTTFTLNSSIQGTALNSISSNFDNTTLTVFTPTLSSSVDSVQYSDKKIKFFKNSNYDLIKYYNAKGDSTEYTYSSNPCLLHLLTNIKLPKGNTISNSYSNMRKLATSSNSVYTANINFSSSYTTSSNTGSSSSVVTSTLNNGGTYTVTTVQNIDGLPTNITTNNGSVLYTYGDPLNTLLPTSAYDNSTGITNTYTYDSKGNLITHSISGGTGTSQINLSESWLYNTTFNEWYSHTDINGNITTRIFNSSGNITKSEQSAGQNVSGNIVTNFNVNPNGLPTSIYNNFLTTNLGYSNKGILNSVQIPALNISSSANHDIYGRYTSMINPNNFKDSIEYDLNDNVIKTIKDPSGLNLVTLYNFDPNNNLLKVIAPKLDSTVMSYEFATDNLLEEKYGGDTKQMTYNTDGSLSTLKNKNGTVFNMSYYLSGDSRAGMLSGDGYKTINVNPTTKRIDNISKGSDVISFLYDGIGRPNSITYTDLPGNTITYQYTNANLTQINYPFSMGSESLEFNSNNLLVKAKWGNRVMAQYFYREDGQLIEERYINKMHKYYYYDAASRLDSVIYKKSNGTTIAGFILQKDSMGNLIKDSSFVNYSNSAVVSNNHLGIDTYNYDVKNRLTSFNGSPNTFNNNGCMLSFGNANINATYDQHDKMINYTRVGGAKTMEYDPLENRRKFDTTRYALDLLNNENILVETNLSGAARNIYLYGNARFCRIDPSVANGMASFYLTDYRGSTITILDSNENVTHYYYYNNGLQGKLDSSYTAIGTFNNEALFVGAHGVVTDDTFLVYMRARYFNPAISRFYSEDPVWSTNLYSYARNNPGNIDPDGKIATIIIAGVVGAGFSAIDYYVSTPKAERNGKGLAIALGKGALTGMLASCGPVGATVAKFANAAIDGAINTKGATGYKDAAWKFTTAATISLASQYSSSKIIESKPFNSAINKASNYLGTPITNSASYLLTKGGQLKVSSSYGRYFVKPIVQESSTLFYGVGFNQYFNQYNH